MPESPFASSVYVPRNARDRLRILTWNVHGNWLYYFSHVPHNIFVITRAGNPAGYARLGSGLPWGSNVYEITEADTWEMHFDIVVYQSSGHFKGDRQALAGGRIAELPSIYVEHDPPCGHPTDSRHPAAAQEGVLLVHVTPFNALMWDSGGEADDHGVGGGDEPGAAGNDTGGHSPAGIAAAHLAAGTRPIIVGGTRLGSECEAAPGVARPGGYRVIEHGVRIPESVRYRGTIASGVTAINHLPQRGRRLGADVYARLAREVPLTLAGMASEAMGGVGEIRQHDLPDFLADYRFFLYPVRYTSLGLAVIEAMMAGLPVVGLATTELVSVVVNGVNGYASTRPEDLIEPMRILLGDQAMARRMGEAGREYAAQRFAIGRFVDDWEQAFAAALE